ncbi:hypothetical protein H9L21_03300 [Aeromicrobium senzhongii]|uniref:DUF4352 domain-containing protein n=1 Tax=Aeromicrobium senzhongii TaxID=2663859 RepID=A0ABX6SW72_9ACTN|nr:hypothetical protein [Aeromicrobium senzhongii]MTB88000.1 hypothetical protein [Aeromicrobium senzhongii]QNL94990.1 hypothetical protein H9L21_03300 [Aeromicrobium senzhongii]
MSDHQDGRRTTRRWLTSLAGLVAAATLAWIVWAILDDQSDASDAPKASSEPATPTEPPQSPTPTATGKPSSAVVPTDEPSPVATDPAGERIALDPVRPADTAKLSRAVSIRVVKIEAVTSKIVLPSDKKGPAVRISVKVANRSNARLDTRFAVVNAYHGDDLVPANVLSEPGGRPIPTSIAAGKTATGVYLFDIGPKARSNVTLEVDLAPQLPVARFAGTFR